MTTEERVIGAVARFRDRVVTTDAVYGTILFAALIAVASIEDAPEDGYTLDLSPEAIDGPGTLTVLLVAVGSLLAFFVAHVYARTIAGHGVRNGTEISAREAFRRAVKVSSGMLLAAIPSTFVLTFGAVGVLPDAADWALLVALVVLFLLGYQALAERRAPVWQRILSGLVSALLGLVVIAIDILAH